MKNESLLDQIMREKAEFAAQHGCDVARIAVAAHEVGRRFPLKPTRETMHLRPGTSSERSLMDDGEIVAEVRRVRQELFVKAGGTFAGFSKMASEFAHAHPLPSPKSRAKSATKKSRSTASFRGNSKTQK